MDIRFVETPRGLLPDGVDCVIIEGPHGLVLQLAADASVRQLCKALTDAVGPYAAASWLHVGQVDWKRPEVA